MRMRWCGLVLAGCLAIPTTAAAAPGDIYVADGDGGSVIGDNGQIVLVNPITGGRTAISSDGLPADEIGFDDPRGVGVLPDGKLAVNGDVFGILVIDPVTKVRTVIPNSANLAPFGNLAVRPDGQILVVSSSTNVVAVNPATGAPTTVSDPSDEGNALVSAEGVAVAPDGSIYVADEGPHAIIRIDPATGNRSTAVPMAKIGQESLSETRGVAVRPDGSLVISDGNKGVFAANPANGDRTLISPNDDGNPETPDFADLYGVAIDANGDAIVVDVNTDTVYRVNLATGARTVVSSNTAPAGEPEFNGLQWVAIEPPLPPVVNPPVVTPPDTVAPGLSGVSVRPARFRVGKGTTFHVTLSEAASLRIAIERRTAGRRVRGKCRKVTKKNHKRKKCTRFVRAGSLSAAAADGGNSIAFSGKLGGKSLKPGRYRATITATDEARNPSAPVEATFQVLKKKPKRKGAR